MTPLISFAKIAEEDLNFLDIDEWPDWQAQFGNSQPLKLEIGFGMGSFLIEPSRNGPATQKRLPIDCSTGNSWPRMLDFAVVDQAHISFDNIRRKII